MFYSLNPVLPWCRCRFVMTHPHNSRCRVSRCTTFMRICSIVCNNPHLCNIIDPHNSKIDFLGRWTNLEAAKLAIFLQTYSCIHDVTQYVSLVRRTDLYNRRIHLLVVCCFNVAYPMSFCGAITIRIIRQVYICVPDVMVTMQPQLCGILWTARVIYALLQLLYSARTCSVDRTFNFSVPNKYEGKIRGVGCKSKFINTFVSHANQRNKKQILSVENPGMNELIYPSDTKNCENTGHSVEPFHSSVFACYLRGGLPCNTNHTK